VAVSWLAGRCLGPAFPGHDRPQWHGWTSARRIQLRGQLRIWLAPYRIPLSQGEPCNTTA